VAIGGCMHEFATVCVHVCVSVLAGDEYRGCVGQACPRQMPAIRVGNPAARAGSDRAGPGRAGQPGQVRHGRIGRVGQGRAGPMLLEWQVAGTIGRTIEDRWWRSCVSRGQTFSFS